MAEKSYKVCDGGAYIYGKFYEGGASVTLNEKQSKYLLLDKTISEFQMPKVEKPATAK